MDARRPPTVLVVEPDTRVARTLAGRLGDCRVDGVPSVRDARERLRRDRVDVLVLDAGIDPGALEFFQAIRFAPEGPRGGIVVLADPDEPRSAEQARQLGAARVLVPPVRLDEVAAAVAELVRLLEE